MAVALAPVMGAAAGLLPDDLHERLMLGDTGANVVGAVLGLAAVLTVGRGRAQCDPGRAGVAELASEAVSFSRVIDLVPPLRYLDRLGRRPPPAVQQAGTGA